MYLIAIKYNSRQLLTTLRLPVWPRDTKSLGTPATDSSKKTAEAPSQDLPLIAGSGAATLLPLHKITEFSQVV